jgi:transposase
MRLRLRVPRPEHEGADLAEQEAWKKKLSQSAQQLQSQDANATVEVWCEDEHRLGLKPMSRRIWVEEGWQPVAQVNWRFQWLWLVGFVHPPTGETKQILLAVDRAGWHLSGELKIPPGIHLELMPSHSPELQPAERLWPLTNEPIANRTFTSLDELEEVLFHRCRVLLHQTDLVRGLTNFYWWPQIAA